MQRQRSRDGNVASGLRTAGVLLLAAHLAVVGWLTLRPLDVPWMTPTNIRPMAGIRADLALGWGPAVRRIVKDLALLAPLGVLLPMAGGRLSVPPLLSLARTLVAGAMISLGIELLQTGVPGQVVDVDSLILNTAGLTLVHLAVVPAGRAALRRRLVRRAYRAPAGPDQEAAQGRPPTFPRVPIAP
ncbi:VanZ family protein [Streptomyces abyssomicinicus]|uniref:VanZ family protein n=1 Tax=Streptomyces abyssomicinicus TaxID=574929 RepID=UPI001250BCFA|nr:VanZ family protein [Streptomyces abyssomicinicus]